MENNRTYFIQQAGIVVSLFCLLLLSSCSEKDIVIASVDDTELTESEALILMEHLGYDANSKEDWKSFVDFWIDRQVFLEELKATSPHNYKLVELRSKAFAGELARFYLEEGLLQKKLNQTIHDTLIQAYYDSHKSDFALNDYIVKALYIKVPKNAPKQDELLESYLLKKNKDFTKVISYAKLYAENFYFDDSTWIYFDELTKDAPIEKLNKDNLVLNRTKTHFSDDDYSYYLNIIDYKLKDALPPIDFMKENIKQILISQRLNEMKDKTENSFIKNVKDKHEINIHL